jgi:hypothetical protein
MKEYFHKRLTEKAVLCYSSSNVLMSLLNEVDSTFPLSESRWLLQIDESVVLNYVELEKN